LKNDLGITEYNFNILEHNIAVYYDKTKTDISKIKKEISDGGFDANEVKANPEARNKLPDNCK
jgi:periplasmic mercuric ion binding protein